MFKVTIEDFIPPFWSFVCDFVDSIAVDLLINFFFRLTPQMVELKYAEQMKLNRKNTVLPKTLTQLSTNLFMQEQETN